MGCKLYEGKTHTQPIIEDPMRGGRDQLRDDIWNFIVLGPGQQPPPDLERPHAATICPGILCSLASLVCPF